MMNHETIAVLILLSSVLISSVSQIFLKISANKTYESRLAEYLNPLVIVAYGMFFVSTILTMSALRYLPLSMSPILESTSYIFVSIMGYFLLKEKFSRQKIAGLIMILLGILIFSVL